MNNLEEYLKSKNPKKILGIFPHPDDETFMMGGLLLKAKELGVQTHVAILTKGEAGQMHIHPHGKTISQIREKELETACQKLGITNLYSFNFSDGKLKQETNEMNVAIANLIKQINPEIVVTYDPSGITGHPDHIITSVEIKKLISDKFPKIDLFWVTQKKSEFVNKKVSEYLVQPDYFLEVGRLWIKKWFAGKCYKSQRFTNKKFWPIARIIWNQKREYYHKVNLKVSYKYKFVDFKI